MEFDFSLISPTAHTIATSAYIDFLPSLQYSKPLGTSRFLKTIQCLSLNGYVVVKLLVKPAENEIDMRPYLDKLNNLKSQLNDVPNTLPFDTLIDSERATYLIRPYVRYNLYERLSIRPFFEHIEKKWIVYQLLVALSRMHEVDVCHGDLKTENVLLTSWSWIILSDIGIFKPVYLPDHNQSQFSFYFDSVQRHSCYIAPERFKTQLEIDELMKTSENMKLTSEMDIFSLGCVIAELYSDGLPIFSLPQMFKYRKGEYIPNLDAIEDSNIRKLIQSMINLDPKKRLSAKDYLIKFRKILFPDYFYTFLYPYIKNLSNYSPSNSDSSSFQKCDYRVDRLYKDFDKIALYLGFKGNIMEFDEKNHHSTSNTRSLIPLKLNLPGMNEHIPQPTSKIFTSDSPNDLSCLILLSSLCHNVRNTTHSLYRIKACDLILAFAEQLHDEAKFDRCLPYLINMLDDPSENVQISALTSITQLLLITDTVTPINIHVFTEYIIPKLQLFLKRSYINTSKEIINGTNISQSLSSNINNENKLAEKFPGSYVRMVFACCLPHLAMASKKLFELSMLLKNKIGSYHDPDIDSIVFNSKDRNESEYDEIVESFEHLTIQILTDSNIYVKIALMKNIQPLCSFFGKDKTNDVILSHLITYLNDKNPQIKLAFVSSIVPVSIFVGVTSLEQYILPLLVQAMYGPEDIIVVTLLKVLSQLIKLGLIRKECFWDLVNLSVVLLLHPNGLIRQSVINFIITIGNQLSTADFYCLLYPLTRPFFQHEVTSFTWENLYIAAHTPLSRSVFNFLKVWSLTNQETLFWHKFSGGNVKDNVDLFGNTKIRFLRKQNSTSNFNGSNSVYGVSGDQQLESFVPNYDVPLSSNDLKQIARLNALGLKPNELWKIATMRAYIYKVARLKLRNFNFNPKTDKSGLIPRNVFVNVKHKYESISFSNRNDINHTDFDDHMKEKQRQKSKDLNAPLILKSLQTPKPIVATTERTAISGYLSPLSNDISNSIFENYGEANVFDETMQLKKISTDITFSYSGKNPFILKFLKSLSFEPDIEDYEEFGSLLSNTRTAELSNELIKPESCTLIAKLNEHKSSVVDIVVSPDDEYFISVDSHGTLKIWESQKLEIDVTGESCLSVNLGSSIKSICIMKDRHVFAISKADGSVDIFRVDFVSSIGAADVKKYQQTSITLLRHHKLKSDDVYATNLQFCLLKGKPYIYMLTLSGKLLGIDIRTMNTIFEFQNNVLHGNTSSLIVDDEQKWAVIGSSKGVIDLIDLDAEICIKSTKYVHGSYPILQMKKIDYVYANSSECNKYICFVGGTGDSDVTIWDIERAQPKIILCASCKEVFSTVEQYSIKEVKDETEDEILGLSIDQKSIEKNKSCTSVFYDASNKGDIPGKLLCSLHNMKVIEWNLDNFEDSRAVVNSFKEGGNVEESPIYSEHQVNSTLSFVYEKNISSKEKDKGKVNIKSENLSRSANKAPSDIVTCLAILHKPYHMVICGDRSGIISVYK
jgi:phosphoinositide-3-kinase regulatory subunit 4